MIKRILMCLLLAGVMSMVACDKKDSSAMDKAVLQPATKVPPVKTEVATKVDAPKKAAKPSNGRLKLNSTASELSTNHFPSFSLSSISSMVTPNQLN